MFALTVIGLIVASLAFCFNALLAVGAEDGISGIGYVNSVLIAFIIVVLSLNL